MGRIRIFILIATLVSGFFQPLFAQPEGWTTPFPPFRIIGPLYGVGMQDLSVFLITTDEGHILINTGLEDSINSIRGNMATLGFRLEDVKILLSQQSHYDHTEALADIKELTGAQVLATAADAQVLEDGGLSDPLSGSDVRFKFKPVQVDRIIQQGDIVELGDVRLMVHEHPGHTQGSSSYTFVVNENGRDYKVGILNIGTINAGVQLVEKPTYPGIARDFAYTYAVQKTMEVDVWVATHNSHYNMHSKWEPGQPYDPNAFVDPYGLLNTIQGLEYVFNLRLLEEQRRTTYPN